MTPDSALDVSSGVGIGEEVGWVGLNLCNLEAGTSVKAIGAIDSSAEGTSEASHAAANLIIADSVRNSDAWWAGESFVGLVNMSCCQS